MYEDLDKYLDTTSQNLKYLLEKYSMSMLQLSHKTGVSYASIYAISQKKSNPTLETLIKISQVFDINLSQLIGELSLENEKQLETIKTIPIILWEKVRDFIKNPKNNNLYTDKILLSSNQLEDNSFALYSNIKVKSLFKEGTILFFNIITKENFENHEGNYVLVSNNLNIPTLKILHQDNNNFFFESINSKIPVTLMTEKDNILAYLICAKVNFKKKYS